MIGLDTFAYPSEWSSQSYVESQCRHSVCSFNGAVGRKKICFCRTYAEFWVRGYNLQVRSGIDLEFHSRVPVFDEQPASVFCHSSRRLRHHVNTTWFATFFQLLSWKFCDNNINRFVLILVIDESDRLNQAYFVYLGSCFDTCFYERTFVVFYFEVRPF